MKNRAFYLRTLNQATNIPFFICTNQFDPVICCPDVMCKDFMIYVAEEASKHTPDTFSPVILTLPLCIYAGYIRLNDNLQMIVGPVTSLSQEEKQLTRILDDFPFHKDKDFIRKLLLFSPNTSMDNLINTMILIAGIQNNAPLTTSDFLLCNIPYSTDSASHLITQNYIANQEEHLSHTPRDYESQLLSYIAAGDLDGLLRFVQNPIPGKAGILSYNTGSNFKYHFIVLVTIVCRTAIRAGADSEQAYSASDTFIRQMDNSSILDNYESLSYAVFKTYCDLVNAASNTTTAPAYLKQCKHYISTHLHTHLTLKDLSDACGYSERWLSQKFRKDAGESLIDYIQKEKLKEACRYLQYTSLSISEISNLLGYSSQSYFNVCFRKYFAMTPQSFRQAIDVKDSIS